MIDSEQLRQRFAELYGRPADGVWAAPGRVNLIGEHTDYNDGFVLPFAVDRATGVAAAVRTDRTDRTVRVSSLLDGRRVEATADLDELRPGSVHGWAAYPLGVLWALQEAGHRLTGLDLLLDSTVPVGAGLSSSAAIECAVAVAVDELAGLGLSRAELTQIGQRAENIMVGAPTGIMDQSASLLGRANHAIFLDCRSLRATAVPLPLADSGLILLVIDTKISHAHATGGYTERRTSCELGARLLGVPALRDLTSADLGRAGDLLDPVTFRRVRHVVTENERVAEAVSVLHREGPWALGPLLNASHESMRDDFEISCPELDLAVDTARGCGALGARMTGGGFGGSAIALAPAEAAPDITQAVREAFAASGLGAPDVSAVVPADGAGRIR